jgi:2,3-bisphosphoglycerate-independent phosphoglycerate mutase
MIDEINQNAPDFICLNFANPDMVGHTGDFEATVKAVETVDQCTQKVVKAVLKQDYTCLVTSDHGNADYMINEDGSPNTAHTKNPVPLFLLNKQQHTLQSGKLGDLAPTILSLMQLSIPDNMTGKVLTNN